MKTTTRQLTLCAMLTALALALSWVERFLPLSLLIPLPGIKLGLANIVTLFALYALGPAQALLILLCRCTLPHDLGRSIAGDQRYMKCSFQFLYIYIKLTKYISLVFSRDFNHQF